MIIEFVVFVFVVCVVLFFSYKMLNLALKKHMLDVKIAQENHIKAVHLRERVFDGEIRSLISNFKLSMRQYVHDKVASHRQIRRLEGKLRKFDKAG